MHNRKIKHILIATGIYPPSIGGPATYTRLLEEELPRLGFTVSVLSFDEVRKWPKGMRHVLYFLKLWRRSSGCDLIYALDPVSVGLPASLVARLKSKLFYLRVAGDYAWEQACQRYGVTDTLDTFLDRSNYYKGVKWLRRVEWSVARYADRIIVPSEYLKRVVEKWGVDPIKMSVIGNAVEGEVPSEDKSVLRSELNIKRPTVITAGRLVPWKGFAVLIDNLAPGLAEDGIDLLIAGDGPDDPMLKSKVEQARLGESVTFLGALSRRDLMRFVKACDVFVLNTAYEGFSHQILEAMALGTPVVSTRVGGNPELVESGTHGYLVNLNDTQAMRAKIKDLIADRALHDQISSRAKERASLYTRSAMLMKLVSLIP